MMSKKQWFVLLCVYVTYLLLGAAVFHEVESTKEYREQAEDKIERIMIEELLVQHYIPNEEHTQNEIFDKLTSYCGRPLSANMSEHDPPIRWDYYHSLFFVITVVSTIGYGNLAPTTTITRIFMIFYAIVGMPMNGMLIINLGDYFSKSFLKLYDRWKTKRVQHALATLGLVGQVVLYLIPGFTFFIFIPSILIMVYEEWPYDVAVHYAFVTLTTIGFGDWVAGTMEKGHGQTLYLVYKIFLLIWIISGLGYVCMVMGFVARGMKSKKMCAIEHKLAVNIKRTNNKIREELREIVNEYLLMRVKRVYRERFIYVPNMYNRSQSCPDLTMYSCKDRESPNISRKRAFSTCVEQSSDGDVTRIQSESDLERIDKERTFNPTNEVLEPGQLLLRVANALGNSLNSNIDNSETCSNPQIEGINLFTSKEILASENYDSGWSMGEQKINIVPQKRMRPRAASEYKIPCKEHLMIENNDLTWYGPAATNRLRDLREQAKYERLKNKTLPPFAPISKPPTFFTRIRNSLKPNETENFKNLDLEGQNLYTNARRGTVHDVGYNRERRRSSLFSERHEKVLEETSIADFLRALTVISVPEEPQQMFESGKGASPIQAPKRPHRSPIQSLSRRTSLMPVSGPRIRPPRRLSLRPEITVSDPPPPYYPNDPSPADNAPKRIITKNRKFSLRPVNLPTTSTSLQRNVLKLKNPVMQELKDARSNGGSSNV